MSHETLQRAAALMREEHRGARDLDGEFYAAVADWLDWIALDYDDWAKLLRGRAAIVPPRFARALTVARAYLGDGE